jgi:hypothetical protein
LAAATAPILVWTRVLQRPALDKSKGGGGGVLHAAQPRKKWCGEGEGWKKGDTTATGAPYSRRGGVEEKGMKRGLSRQVATTQWKRRRGPARPTGGDDRQRPTAGGRGWAAR